MTHKILCAGLVAAGLTTLGAASASAQQTPIIGTGWNRDFVVETGGTYGSGTLTATIDAGAGGPNGNSWYQVGQNAAAPTTGIPSGTTFPSAADPATTYLLQPATGNNGILVDVTGGGTFTLTTPAPYSTLSFAASTGNGNNVINYTAHFGDGGTLAGAFTAPDWFGGTPIAYTANGRINNTGYDSVNSGNPRIYQEDITAANFGSQLDSLGNLVSAQPLDSITFAYVSGNGHTDIQAISGTSAVPEPSTWMGASGLLLLAAGDFRRRLKTWNGHFRRLL